MIEHLDAAGISDIFEFIDTIKLWFTDFGRWIADPIWLWYLGFAAVVAICIVLAVFLPFKWTRVGLGGVILLAFAYLMGGRRMHGQVKGQVEEERRRYEELKAKQKERGGSGGGGWFS